jgi:hypothetical protein
MMEVKKPRGEQVHFEMEMCDLLLPQSIVDYFASLPLPGVPSVGNVLRNGPDNIRTILKELISSIPEKQVEQRAESPEFHCNLHGESRLQFARQELIEQTISKATAGLRFNYLCTDSLPERPNPYSHPVLIDLPLDPDHLVDISYFNLTPPHRILKDGFEFHIVPTLPQENSSYWLKTHIFQLSRTKQVFIRLDPFMIQPQDGILAPEYRMLVYGIPLDPESLKTLKKDQHSRWMPENLDYSDIQFTDVVWSPRQEGEIHFICEEVPKTSTLRGARYLHAILDVRSNTFIHADGAIRFYSDTELSKRKESHVRHAGKMGKRVNIFRIEGYLDFKEFSGISSSFFVWNEDVMNYFSGN